MDEHGCKWPPICGWSSGRWHLVSFLIVQCFSSLFTCNIILGYANIFLRVVPNLSPFSFSFALKNTLLVDATTYMCSAKFRACISVGVNDVLKYNNGSVSTCTVVCSWYSNQVGHSDKMFDESCKVLFHVLKTAFVVIEFLSFTCHRYRRSLLQEYCRCQWQGTLHTLRCPGFDYGTLVTFVLNCFDILHDTIVTLRFYVLLIYISDNGGIIQGKIFWTVTREDGDSNSINHY